MVINLFGNGDAPRRCPRPTQSTRARSRASPPRGGPGRPGRPAPQVGVVGEFLGSPAGALREVALGHRLYPPDDAFDQPVLVPGVRRLSEHLRVAQSAGRSPTCVAARPVLSQRSGSCLGSPNATLFEQALFLAISTSVCREMHLPISSPFRSPSERKQPVTKPRQTGLRKKGLGC